MRTLFIIFLSLFLVGSAQAQDRFIDKNEVDEFTGQKTVLSVSVEMEVLEAEPGTDLVYHKGYVAYTQLEGESVYFMVLSTASESWIFLGAETAYFLVDGERYKTPLFETERETMGRGVSHNLAAYLNQDIRSALRNAENVRMKVGEYVFNVTDVVDDELEAVEREVRR